MPESIRSFVAVELPQELKKSLAAYLARLNETAPKVKWVKSESIHITLKFLGNQAPETVDRILPHLMEMPRQIAPITVSSGRFGAFPGRKNPRVFWLGLEDNRAQALTRLQHQVESSLQELGIEKDKRKFRAHLTLGRVKFAQDFDALWEWVENNPFPPCSFEVREFVLMRSILKPEGAVYRVLQKYSLQEK